MGHCNYSWCIHTRQGCFRPDCKFQPSREYSAWDAFNDLKLALKDAEYVFSSEKTALDAIEYIKQKLDQIQRAD